MMMLEQLKGKTRSALAGIAALGAVAATDVATNQAEAGPIYRLDLEGIVTTPGDDNGKIFNLTTIFEVVNQDTNPNPNVGNAIISLQSGSATLDGNFLGVTNWDAAFTLNGSFGSDITAAAFSMNGTIGPRTVLQAGISLVGPDSILSSDSFIDGLFEDYPTEAFDLLFDDSTDISGNITDRLVRLVDENNGGNVVPEPSTTALLALGMLAGLGRKRFKDALSNVFGFASRSKKLVHERTLGAAGGSATAPSLDLAA